MFIAIIGLLLPCWMRGQNLKNDRIKQIEIKQHRKYLVGKCIQAYTQACSLIDTTTNEVSAASMERFKDLFLQNAKVWNDISETPTLISTSDYVGAAYIYLKNEGINTRFLNEYNFLKGEYAMKSDSTEKPRYYQKVQLEKILYNGLDQKKRLKNYRKGRKFYLEFDIYVNDDEKRAFIMNIRSLP
ncbi:MAG: hypothetical protein RLZZ292_1803 [Bacteroidota bacterium]